MITQIAKVLKISVQNIKEATEWANVWFVKFNQGRSTFVSKKALTPNPKTITYKYPDGRQVKMIYLAKGQKTDATRMAMIEEMYEIFVDGEFESRESINWVLDGLAKLTATQKQEISLVIA
jgi:hypothetical protein